MKRTIIITVLVVAAIAGIIAWRSGKVSFIAGENPALSEEEIQDIVTKISKHIRVPDEEPLVALITDIDALVAEQPFYAGAENGDILIIYPSVSKAILYSEKKDVLINVGPIILDEAAQTTSPPAAEATEETPEEEAPAETTE